MRKKPRKLIELKPEVYEALCRMLKRWGSYGRPTPSIPQVANHFIKLAVQEDDRASKA